MSSLSPRPLAPAAAGRTSERAAGETTFKFNEPAKAGRVLPGLSGEAHVWDDRLSFGISETYGRDLADGRRVLTSQQLGHGANWQREAGFNLTVPESDALNFSMFGGLYDARRPARLRERALHLGEVETWGEHQGIDIGFNLGLLDNRVRYKGGYAWSDYERVELNTERAASGNGFGPTGDAQQHRLEVDILTEGSLKMSAYGLYQTGDPSFRRPRRSGVKQPFTIGETREIGTSLRLDELRFSLVQQDRALHWPRAGED